MSPQYECKGLTSARNRTKEQNFRVTKERKKKRERNSGKRLFAGVTTMLNFFTTSNGFRSTLPVVSNLTAMNVWDGVCMCFIYASLLEFVCVNYVGRKRPMHNVVYRPGENPVTQVLLLSDVRAMSICRPCRHHVHIIYIYISIPTLLLLLVSYYVLSTSTSTSLFFSFSFYFLFSLSFSSIFSPPFSSSYLYLSVCLSCLSLSLSLSLFLCSYSLRFNREPPRASLHAFESLRFAFFQFYFNFFLSMRYPPLHSPFFLFFSLFFFLSFSPPPRL